MLTARHARLPDRLLFVCTVDHQPTDALTVPRAGYDEIAAELQGSRLLGPSPRWARIDRAWAAQAMKNEVVVGEVH